ncbi:gp57 [Listeria phage P40]|uniref:gp57 n=1 Tax=Listeria phage P40 TaxID=560178 RepID=UPI0001819906|nr:gp57 [Listeria phage P40]ACI00417.1 gp57 [Listeria phage P40]
MNKPIHQANRDSQKEVKGINMMYAKETIGYNFLRHDSDNVANFITTLLHDGTERTIVLLSNNIRGLSIILETDNTLIAFLSDYRNELNKYPNVK